jgi:ATP-dependent Zn protease
VLDSAILSRPGRFDKVVVVNAPDHTLRARYLKHLFRKLPTVTETDIGYMADETESMSMAFLKEVFVVTASRAIMAGEIVGRKHIDSALEEVQRQYGGVSKSNARKAGFGS